MINARIQQLIIDHLFGRNDEAAARELAEWLQERPEHQRLMDRLLQQPMVDEYADLYHRLDTEASWQAFCRQHHPEAGPEEASAADKRPSGSRRRAVGLLLRAAVVMLLVGSAVTILWNGAHRVEPVAMTEVQQQAMTHAAKADRVAATITLTDGRTISAKTDSALREAVEATETNALVNGKLVTRHDKEFWVTLSDGTRVHLNYGSSLEYPIAFTGSERRVRLQGEAYFMVAENRERPFIVSTEAGDIKEYGTEFNVNTRSEDGLTRVVLVHGSISVTPKGGREQMLRPSEMASISGQKATVTHVDVQSYIAWNTGTLDFEDYTLETLMKVIGDWYNVRAEFESEELRRQRFSGMLEKYSPLSETLQAIREISGIRITQDGDRLLISQ